MRRIYAIAGIAAVIALGVYLGAQAFGSGGAAGYRTEAASRGDIAAMVSANGTLNPVKVVNVGAQISGRIKKLHVDFNDQVVEGQVLAELDDALLKAQLAQSEAQLSSAAAQLNLAQVNYDRAANLASRGAGAKADKDTAAANLGVAKASMEAAEANVAKDRVNLSYAVIASPVSGVVMSRDVDEGQTVAASLSAPQIYSIAQDLSKMQINTTVAEADVGSIKADMPVSFRVDAFPNRRFRGVVRQVRLNPTTESNVVSYNVVIDVDNADLTLLPGMTAYVQITIATAKDVLRAPNAALRFRPADAAAPAGGSRRGAAEATRTIYVLEGGAPKPVEVTVGITDGKLTEVSGEGLTEGAAVVIGSAPTAEAAPAARSSGGMGGGPRMF